MIAIRIAHDADEEGIRSLFSLCFGRELSHDEWIWKYKASPWGSTATVATDGGAIVAHYGGLGMKLRSPDRDFAVYQPCDVMTHPKYRARVFAKRGAMVRAGELFYSAHPMDFAFGFPSERHAILGTRLLGYTEHGYVTVMRKELSGVRETGRRVLKTEHDWDRIKCREIDALWSKVRDTFALSIQKNAGYIFWRYRDNPLRQYIPLIVRSRFAGALKAFAVCSTGDSELSLLDFFVTSGFQLETLLGVVEGLALRSGCQAVRTWVNPEEAVCRTLALNGYARSAGVPFIFKTVDESIEPSFLFSRYCYRMGDYDAS